MNNKVKLFLDSGAFSAFTQGAEIDIQEYIEFIKKHEHQLEVYANLDVIGSPEGTWRNQMIMEKAGLNPLPCFHYGEDFKWLRRYFDRGYKYIALGGMASKGMTSEMRRSWLDIVFSQYICDKEGMPKVKVHGFGMTSLRLMLRYPWYSVDSTSWVVTGRLGAVLVPKFRKGRYVYNEDPWKVDVSNRSPTKKQAGKHLTTMSKMDRETILRYIHEKGYQLGKSEFRMVAVDYELKDNEKWTAAAKHAKNGKREVERIIEPGLANDYKLRDELNIIYFLDLEKSMPKWPWAFKSAKRKRLMI